MKSTINLVFLHGNLNTYHVKVQLISIVFILVVVVNLNTYHVKVQLQKVKHKL